MRHAAFFVACLCVAAPVAADAPALSLPIDCRLGKTCYIQNYVDRDPGPNAQDFRCGGLSYDGHKGTDFGLPTLADMRRGVDVLASAPGVVRGFRDGVDDVGRLLRQKAVNAAMEWSCATRTAGKHSIVT